jgi:hypothetical protein
MSIAGVVKFDDRFVATTICAPVLRSWNVSVLKPKIAPSWPYQSAKRRIPRP